MCLFTCLPLFVSTLSSGVRLCGCLFFAFTCFSSFVSYHVSPNLSVSRLYNLSPIIRLLLDLSPKSFVSNHMYALVAVSLVASSLFLIPVCLCSFLPCVFLLSQDQIMFDRGFMRFTACLPVVSYLVSLSWSQIQMAWQKSKLVAWKNDACDSCCPHLTWSKHCQYQELL